MLRLGMEVGNARDARGFSKDLSTPRMAADVGPQSTYQPTFKQITIATTAHEHNNTQ